MAKNLHTLPLIQDCISYLYIEYAKIEVKNYSLVVLRKDEETVLPICKILCILLGPGTSITHDAIKVIGDSGCMIVWCGDELNYFYSYGSGRSHNVENLYRQIHLFHNNKLQVAEKMFRLRFPSLNKEIISIEQLMGIEGTYMKSFYNECAKKYNVEWDGREFVYKNPKTNIINKAISIANSLLYNICQAGILSLGYSADIGFAHAGNLRSFVYDIADLYKIETSIPSAFETISEDVDEETLPERVRKNCRDLIYSTQVLKRIPQDIKTCLE